MLRDIVRFNSAAEMHLDAASANGYSVGDLLTAGRYGAPFRQNYLLPMAAAIWSCATSDVLRFPAATFLRFGLNHALLQVNRRPRWKTVAGGAREYVRRIVATLDDVRTNERVVTVRRERGSVHVASESGCECFDAAILATHAPDSLRILADPDPDERHVLGAIRYQPNVAWLHTDLALLPRRERIWSAWNYLSTHGVDDMHPVCVSYLINRLQPLPFKRPVIVDTQSVATTLARNGIEALRLRSPAARQRGRSRANPPSFDTTRKTHMVRGRVDRLWLS